MDQTVEEVGKKYDVTGFPTILMLKAGLGFLDPRVPLFLAYTPKWALTRHLEGATKTGTRLSHLNIISPKIRNHVSSENMYTVSNKQKRLIHIMCY